MKYARRYQIEDLEALKGYVEAKLAVHQQNIDTVRMSLMFSIKGGVRGSFHPEDIYEVADRFQMLERACMAHNYLSDVIVGIAELLSSADEEDREEGAVSSTHDSVALIPVRLRDVAELDPKFKPPFWA